MTETGYEEQDLSYTVEDRDGEEGEGEELEEDIYEREAKPQVGPVSSRDVSPDCVLPALEDVTVVPPSILSTPTPAPLMTIPPHILSQLLTTTTTTSTARHTAFTPVNPPLLSPPSAFFTKQQVQKLE